VAKTKQQIDLEIAALAAQVVTPAYLQQVLDDIVDFASSMPAAVPALPPPGAAPLEGEIIMPLSGGPQTKSSMLAEVLANLPDNTSNLITPLLLRTTLNDMIASYQQYCAVNAQSGTTYTIATSDYGQLVQVSNASPIAVTLPPPTGSFATFSFFFKNAGASTATITPTTSTINGAASLAVTGGNAVYIVSDGTNWQAIAFAGTGGGGRTILAAATTFFVSTTGNDANNGLTSGTAWLTLQHAMNVLAGSYDFGGQNVTVQVGNGTYTAGVNITPWVGGGTLTFLGNTGSPSSCVVNTAGNCFAVQAGALPGALTLNGFRVMGGVGIYAAVSCVLTFSNFDFNTCSGNHITVQGGASVLAGSNYTISGSASVHAFSSNVSYLQLGFVATLTGTPNFAAFAQCFYDAVLYAIGASYSGSATGTRYSAAANGVIQTGGGGANFFPGNAAGSTSSGGQYL